MSRYRSRPATDSHLSTTTVTSPNAGPWWGPSPRGYNQMPDHYPPVTPDRPMIATVEWGARYLHLAANGRPDCGAAGDTYQPTGTDDAYPCDVCFAGAIL